MGKFKSSHQKELGYIPQAHLIAQAAHQYLEDDIGRNFDEIEWSAGSLVKGAIAVSTAKHRVSEVSKTFQTGGTAGGTVGAGYQIQTGYIFQVNTKDIRYSASQQCRVLRSDSFRHSYRCRIMSAINRIVLSDFLCARLYFLLSITLSIKIRL